MAAAPLTGSPFDLFNGGSGGLAGGGGIGGQSSTLNNPLLQMLSQGSTLEQITTLTKNLLQMSNGNKEILSTLMNAITGGTGQTSKLTSSALATASLQKQPPQINSAISTFLAGNKSALPSAVIIEDEELFGINGTSNNKFLGREEIKEVSTNGTFASPNGFSLEQRKLLAAAVLNGELDPEQAVRLLTSENGTIANETISELNKTNIDNSLFDYEEQQHQTFYGLLDKNTKKNQHLINSESKLIEWIQQNRPRHSSENLNENKNATTTFTPLNRDWTNSIEKLPYWGRYCGSFVAQTDNSPYNIAGAVWTVDERRLLITKFTFIPYSHFENITFWAGPSKPTGNAALDLFPSENGFIVEAIPLELNIFNRNPIQIEAKIFNDNIQMDKTEAIFKNENGSKKVGKKNDKINLLAEREEEEDDEKIIITTNTTSSNNTKRDRRNLYNEIFGNKSEETANNISNVDHFDNNLVNQEIRINLANKVHDNETNIIPVNVQINNESLTLDFDNEGKKQIENENPIEKPNKQQQIKNLILFQQQTLLLTLPEEHFTKNINWLAIWEHEENNKNKEPLAVVLMPKGLEHQIPSIVQIRAFPSPAIGINGVKMLQSGPIKVLDTKTIEITEFTFKTEQVPAWFMVGKEIMPNAKGHIVPIFDRKNSSFNCDSLREFNNETVTLRLPDPFDIKDVFWFAIFSIPKGIPLSHIYLPYNDMRLPPDLLALQTPQCIWKRILPNRI